jgi:protein-L-isoaspartate O-methyltransferase
VPRVGFLPDVVWRHDMGTGAYVAVRKGEDPEGWVRAAFDNVAVVTQWDDGGRGGDEQGVVPTSSASMPSVVAGMLRDLDVRDGMRVIEIGTGTGWNAGLLAHRLGDSHVVSVEVDAAVAGRARGALGRAGLRPEVVCADGEFGWAAGAPYDRLIVTAGVRAVPVAWLEQVRVGGCILAPWGTHFGYEDALVRLVVDEDGGAAGRFLRPVEFMKLRGQRLDWDAFRGHVPEFPGDADVSKTSLALADLGGRHSTARFVAGLCVPGCAHVVNRVDESVTRAWFFDTGSRSWSAVDFSVGEAAATVYQSGERRLWDEVERALVWWAGRGRPELGRFGLTVRADGTQRPWFDHPDNVLALR